MYVPEYRPPKVTVPFGLDTAVSFTVVPSEAYNVKVAPANAVPEVVVFVKVKDFSASSELITLLLGSVNSI